MRARVETQPGDDDKSDRRFLTVTNDQSAPIVYEAEIGGDENWTFTPDGRLERRNGRSVWRVTIPANGTAVLRYRVVEHED